MTTHVRFGSRNKVAIAGFAQSAIQRRAPVPLGALAVDTCLKAIADAGLTRDQIDGFTTAALLPSSGAAATSVDGIDIVSANWMAAQIGVRPRWVCGFTGGGQIPGSVILAVNAIASGSCNYVLLHRALSNPPGRYHENPIGSATRDRQWTAPYGFWGPPAHVALLYQEYMQRYGATREEMATLVVQSRKNAAGIPWAYWKDKPLTVDDYMNARMIADPISVLDCDIPVDGVAAFVLTSAERARDLPHRPVYITGFAQGPHHPHRSRTLDELMSGGNEVARKLWEDTGLSVKDIDVPQMYDGFSPIVYFWLECLGFCAAGEAHRFIQEGRIDPTGDFPMNSGAGALGNGRMHGVPQMLECYLQLSRRALGRQLPRANVGIACQAFPDIGGTVMYSAEPF